MRILVIGASGFIGRNIYSFLKKEGIDVIGTYFKNKILDEMVHLDVLDEYMVRDLIVNNDFDFIIFTAGNKNTKECENNYEKAYKDNVVSVENIVKAIKCKKETRFLFFSSDYVFDGEKGNYKDTDIPFPKTNYGKTKLIAEDFLKNSGIDYKIVRTSAVVGNGSEYYNWLINSLKTKDKIEAFLNIYFTPTPINFLTKNILKLLICWKDIPQDILHIVGNEKMNRYRFTCILKELIKSKTQVIGINADFKNTLFQKDLSLLNSSFFVDESFNLIDYLKQINDEADL